MGKTVTWWLNYEGGYLKIFVFTRGGAAAVRICSDLYDTARLNTKGELFSACFCCWACWLYVTAGISYVHPNSFWAAILGAGPGHPDLCPFRMASGYGWLVQLPMLVERVYVSGSLRERAAPVQGLRKNPEIGVEIASWTGKLEVR